MPKIIDLDDDEQFTRAQLKQKIAFMLGRRQNTDTPLNVGSLNSAYAHLTGGFYTNPRWVDTEHSPGVDRMRWGVVLAVDRAGWDMSSYFPDPEQPEGQNRPFRRAELETLAHCLNQTDDSRAWLEQ